MRTLFLWLFSFLAFFPSIASAQLPPDLQRQLVRHGQALIIGVWKYREWPQLTTVDQQIKLLAVGLNPHFNNIMVLRNPTVSVLQHTIHDFFSIAGDSEDERLFVYYVGHGFTDKVSQTGFITGVDTPAYDPDDRRAVRNALSMRDYDSLTRNSLAPQVLTVFNSCFAGTVFSSSLGPTQNLIDYTRVRDALRHRIRYYITAGGANEEVPDTLQFAQALMNGLNGGATQSEFVTAEELGIYLYSEMPRLTEKLIRPQYGAVNSADFRLGKFVFFVPPSGGGIPQPSVQSSFRPAPLPFLPRSYLVFFDWQSAALSDRARQIVSEAAENTKKVPYNRVDVSGYYADLELSPQAMREMSERQARAVAAELVRDGVPEHAIATVAYGSSQVLVPAKLGEPQNRRVEIIVR